MKRNSNSSRIVMSNYKNTFSTGERKKFLFHSLYKLSKCSSSWMGTRVTNRFSWTNKLQGLPQMSPVYYLLLLRQYLKEGVAGRVVLTTDRLRATQG